LASVIGARIVIITNNVGTRASRNIVTSMVCTCVTIITVLERINTATTSGAGVYSTSIIIIARNGCINAGSLIARVCGTQVLIIARYWSVIAKTFAAGIVGTEIVIITHDRCVDADSVITGIGSTVIVVVTVYGGGNTSTSGRVTGIVGT
jgi:hypothetical protein